MTFFAMKLHQMMEQEQVAGIVVVLQRREGAFSHEDKQKPGAVCTRCGHEGGGGGLGLWTQVLQPGGDEVEDCLHYLLKVGCEVVAG